jgi:hypothetical protein
MKNDKQSFELEILQSCQKIAANLYDSPVSRRGQILNSIGFYQGYCAAKDWETDISLIVKCENMA